MDMRWIGNHWHIVGYTTGIVTVSPGIAQFSDFPVSMVCPHCRNQVVTVVSYEPGNLTWLACFGLFFFTLCCFWIPFCIKSMKDVVHRCPRCGFVLGKYQRL